MASTFFTVAQLAAYLGFSEKAVRARVYRREIPFIQIGRRIIFKRDDIDAWLKAHTITEV
jgi:excisionase family DNA binding protein